MTQIKLKRVYDTPDSTDGYRIFVDKLWPRGIKKEALKYDLWAKKITPSDEIRKMFHKDQDANWESFSFLYQKELSLSDYAKDFINEIKDYDVVTLLYASANKVHNHALVLKSYLEKAMS